MKIARNGDTLTTRPKSKAVWISLCSLFGIFAIVAFAIFDATFPAALFATIFAGLLWTFFWYFLDRIEMNEDSVRLRRAFRNSEIAWDEIESISRMKGMGVALTLKDGRVIYGPDLGNATSTSNILRAELRNRSGSKTRFAQRKAGQNKPAMDKPDPASS